MSLDFWPGTDIRRSTNNGFTRGLSDSPTEWSRLGTSGKQSSASTATVERRREAADDAGGFIGTGQQLSEAKKAKRAGARA